MAIPPLNPCDEFRSGVRDILPLALGVAVYGLAFGLLATRAGMGPALTGTMSAMVFAGSAQIMTVQQVVAGAGAVSALIAGVALNLRLLLITASLREELQGRRPWHVLLGVHLASDENWALMHATRAAGRPAGYWYLIGGGLHLWVVWVAATMAGAAFARHIPDPHALGLDFAFTAAFIAILRNLWKGPSHLMPWAVSAGVVVVLVLATPFEPARALVVGGLAGAVMAGMRADG